MTVAQRSLGEPRTSPEALFEALFRPLGVEGVYARSGAYEAAVEALGGLIGRHREPGAEILRFPPVVPRALIEKSGYLSSFPHLLGCVCGLSGDEAAIGAAVDRFESGRDWTGSLAADELVLAPAACYPVYPLAAAAGPVPAGGSLFDVACDCFRREPSRAIDRLQSFRMREFVFIGAPEAARAFRDAWMARAAGMADALGLVHRLAPASDPFFGRGGVIVGKAQAQQALKFELLVPVRATAQPTACMSFNCHRDHFGATWGIRDADGGIAHTACVAFGLDRLALALFATHGVEAARWPSPVRATLGL
jgi:seryl-tRNA synthetase